MSARWVPTIRTRCRPKVEALEDRWTPCTLGALADMPPVPLLPPPLPGPFTAAASGLPLLNSRPGAPATVYLDFDGGVGYGDNLQPTHVYTPYDEDGDPTSFRAAEQSSIYEAWRQVAAYFAPLDLDVTTAQPPLTVPTAWVGIGNNIDNGYAYIGTFPTDRASGYVNSYFARTRQSGIAHEAGHIFGLEHQATYDRQGVKVAEYAGAADPLHGPVMGIDFDGVVHKWSIGHPSDVYVGLAGSPATVQDDLFIISGQVRRFAPDGDGYRADDFPGTLATATPLAGTEGVQSAAGVIERLGDADAFSFTSPGGAAAVAADRDTPSGVALRLEVYDSAGKLVAAKSGPTNDQHLTLDLPAGTYYALVAGQGNYADVGAYRVSARPLPAGWDTQDVGLVGWAGYAGYDAGSGTFAVGGSGGDIGGSADGFRFVYQTLSGNGSITARVTAVEDTSPSAKAGVMIRESLARDARHASMALRPSGIQFLRRTAAGGGTFTTSASGQAAPYWVRLARSGNSFFGYRSADGVTWTLQGSTTIDMGPTVFVGLAVTSRVDQQNGAVNDAAFAEVAVTGTVNPPPPSGLPAPTGLSLSAGTGTAVVLSWNGVVGATGYAVDRSVDNVRWAQVATSGPGQLTYTDAPPGSHRYFYRVSAVDAAGRSAPSAAASLVNGPSAPAGLTLTTWNDMTILDWRDVSGETGYRVERSLDGNLWTVLGLVDPNVPSFTDPVPVLGSLSSYRVVATGPAGDSAASAVLSRLPTLVNAAPVVTEPAAASPSPVAGLNTGLSVAAADDGGPSGLTYLWATTAKPAGAPHPTFSRNNANDARTTAATFRQAGTYTFTVTVTDTGGRTATSSVGVTVHQTLSRIAVSPRGAHLPLNGTQQFAATAFDQFDRPMSPQPAVGWAVTAGGGTVDPTGRYTAPGSPGSAAVTAASGDGSDTVPVTVVNTVAAVARPAAADPSPVTGTTTALSVLGADDGGEASLTYIWEATAVPAGAVPPTYSANRTNAARDTTATFSQAGEYTFVVTIADALGVGTISAVTVAVEQTLTRVALTPAAASVVINNTQQFAATAKDQFGFPMAVQPAFTWSVNGVGTIDPTGLFIAPGDTGTATVFATGGGVTGSAAVTVLLPAPSNLTATAHANGRVQLKWKDNTTLEDGFQVETSVDGITWTLLTVRGPSAGSGSNVTFNTDPLPAGKRYFRVRAFNAGGTSGYSNIATVTV